MLGARRPTGAAIPMRQPGVSGAGNDTIPESPALDTPVWTLQAGRLRPLLFFCGGGLTPLAEALGHVFSEVDGRLASCCRSITVSASKAASRDSDSSSSLLCSV